MLLFLLLIGFGPLVNPADKVDIVVFVEDVQVPEPDVLYCLEFAFCSYTD
jgi:hypothetical protein